MDGIKKVLDNIMELNSKKNDGELAGVEFFPVIISARNVACDCFILQIKITDYYNNKAMAEIHKKLTEVTDLLKNEEFKNTGVDFRIIEIKEPGDMFIHSPVAPQHCLINISIYDKEITRGKIETGGCPKLFYRLA